MCETEKQTPAQPPAILIPRHWASAMQLQVKTRAIAKVKVSNYILAHGVRSDQQMIDLVQSFLDETGRRQGEAKYLIGDEGAFQTMVLGLAGVALVDIVLEIVTEGLRKQAASANAAGAKPLAGGPDTHGSIIETPGAASDDRGTDDNGQKPEKST